MVARQDRSVYDFRAIEAKWQAHWDKVAAFRASDETDLPKYYVLVEFPYPSGEGLHVGHPRSYTALDVIARKRRMEGYNVLFPMGWDAFGLPTENFAIKQGEHPREITVRNIARFKQQLKRLGFSFDWSREIDTTDPAYYRWTQWIFLQLFKKGLAYKAEMPVNWCTQCKVGLSNEEVVGGACDRCGGEVVRKVRSQWMLRITEYADRLIADLDHVDFPGKVRAQQTHWIGRSDGVELSFPLADRTETIQVYTTRPDTIFGVTYMVLAPEHPLVERLLDVVENPAEIRTYRQAAARKSEFERSQLIREVSGVALKGVHAINPASGGRIPIWISDYVLLSYGTGAIMAVPGHDARDWRFARHFGLSIREVIAGGDVSRQAYTDSEQGTLVNSVFLNGLSVKDAIVASTRYFEERRIGKAAVNYKLRDWVFSRQRYWGEPIPLVLCARCGWVAIPEEDLPLTLPEVERYQASGTGESPLALLDDWVNTACPACGGPATRETDTMPQWAGSSWYFLRYLDPGNGTQLARPDRIRYWMPVDWYNGGMEHTTLHLLYSRFWHKFLYDIGVVPMAEPYARRTSHGMILGEDSEKMSKSRGNVVNPDELVERFGADSFRVYEMFVGDFESETPWSTRGLIGVHRFLNRVWRLQDKVVAEPVVDPAIERLIHQTIEKVGRDIEAMKFNTAIASLMSVANTFSATERIGKADFATFVLLLSPFAPHMAEELWANLGHAESLARHGWPEYHAELAAEDTVELVVQVNGKVRSSVTVRKGTGEDDVKQKVLADPKIRTLLNGKTIRRWIVVPDKLVNLVI